MKTENKCVVCKEIFKYSRGEVDAFCCLKCEGAFKKLVGLPEEAEFVKPEMMRYPHLVILSADRIVRVRLKSD